MASVLKGRMNLNAARRTEWTYLGSGCTFIHDSQRRVWPSCFVQSMARENSVMLFVRGSKKGEVGQSLPELAFIAVHGIAGLCKKLKFVPTTVSLRTLHVASTGMRWPTNNA